jgi:hypothetical protein
MTKVIYIHLQIHKICKTDETRRWNCVKVVDFKNSENQYKIKCYGLVDGMRMTNERKTRVRKI